MRRFGFLLLLGILLLVVARLSFFTVDAAEYAYVTVLGRHTVTLDGGPEGDGAGLHLGWPWPIQSVLRFDRRLQFFDLPPRELLTPDPTGENVDKTLLVEAHVCWRIADREAVDRFVRRLATFERARGILEKRVSGKLGSAFTRITGYDLINTDAGKDPGKSRVEETIAALEREVLADLREPVLQEYGIELVDICLRRYSYPGDTRKAIFNRIRSERAKKVTEYQAEGERLARNKESEGEEKARTLLAQARQEEERIKSEADAQAMKIRNQAHAQDPEYYAFLKKLEKLQAILESNKTLLLLSTNRPMFDLLFRPPSAEGTPPGKLLMPLPLRPPVPPVRKVVPTPAGGTP